MKIAQKIKELRQNKNMTQEELASKLNVSRQTISKWETDVATPDAYNIIEICKLFDISTDELLNNEIKKKVSNNLLLFSLLIVSVVGFIIFGILLLTDKVNEYSSMITLNAYGIFCFLFFMIHGI